MATHGVADKIVKHCHRLFHKHLDSSRTLVEPSSGEIAKNAKQNGYRKESDCGLGDKVAEITEYIHHSAVEPLVEGFYPHVHLRACYT